MPSAKRLKRNAHLPLQTLVATASALLITAAPSLAADEFHLSNEFSQTYNSLTGPGKSQSALTEGMRFLDILNANGAGNLSDQWTYNFNLGLKATDDIKNDAKRISLTNLNLKLSNKIHTLTLGDTYESFSQYSLNTSVKGGSYKYANDNGAVSEFTVLAGLAYPRWDNAFNIGYGITDAPERLIYGARVRKDILEDVWLGANVVAGRDMKRVYSTDMAYEQTLVYSFDVEYKPLPGLTITGEAAYAYDKETAQEGAASTTKHGSAYRVQAVGDQDPSRVVLEYERVSTDFFTLAGSATPDREKAKATWRYKATKNTTTNLGFLWFHDNLDGSKVQGTTNYYKPEAGITFKNFIGRRYASLGLTYKFDYSTRQGDSVKSDNIFNTNYRDRYGFIDTDLNFGYIAYNTLQTARSRNNEFTYNLTLSSRHSFDTLILSPSVYLGGWRSNNELADTNDQIYEASAGTGIDFPSLNISSNVRGGFNKLQKSAGDDTAKTFASANINWRPTYLKQLMHVEQTMLYVRYAMNDLRFTTTATDRDYRENSITAGFNFNF